MSCNSASTSPSSTTSAFLTDDTFMGFGMEVDPTFEDIFEVQDQLCWLLEVKQEEDMWQWMEMRWAERMLERDLVALGVNTQSARMAGGKAVAEIWKKWYAVSVGFLYLGIQISDCHFVGFE